MRKILIGVLIVILLSVGGYFAYLRYGIVKFEKLLVYNTDMLIHYNPKELEVEKQKNFRNIYERMIKEAYKDRSNSEEIFKAYENIQKLEKYLGDIFVLHTEQSLLGINSEIENLDIVAGIGLRTYYLPIRLFYLKKAFDKTEDKNYILKEELKKQILEGQDISKFEIYMKPYKGYFIFSFSQRALNSYFVKLQSDEKADNLIAEYKKIKENNLGAVIFDLNVMTRRYQKLLPTKDFYDELSYLKMYYDYDFIKEKMKIYLQIEGKGKVFDLIDSRKVNKEKILEYYSEDSIYIANNDYSKVTEYVLDLVNKYNKLNYRAVIRMVTGVDILDLVKNLGDQLIFKFESKENISAISNIENKDIFIKALDSLGNEKKIEYVSGQKEIVYDLSEKYKLTFGKDKLYINNKIKKEFNEVNLDEESFLYSKMNSETLLKKFPIELTKEEKRNFEKIFNDVKFEFIGRSKENYINLNINLDKKEMLKIMKHWN